MSVVAYARSDRLDRRLLAVCDAVGAFIQYWGFKAVYGRVWTLLAVSREPLSQTALAQALGVSRSLISGTIAELRDLGLVRPVGDHRNAPYEAIADVWPTISEVLRTREWIMLEQARGALEAAVEEAELQVGVDASMVDVVRLRQLLTMTETAQGLLRMLIGLRMPSSIEGYGRWLSGAARFVKRMRRADRSTH